MRTSEVSHPSASCHRFGRRDVAMRTECRSLQAFFVEVGLRLRLHWWPSPRNLSYRCCAWRLERYGIEWQPLKNFVQHTLNTEMPRPYIHQNTGGDGTTCPPADWSLPRVHPRPPEKGIDEQHVIRTKDFTAEGRQDTTTILAKDFSQTPKFVLRNPHQTCAMYNN